MKKLNRTLHANMNKTCHGGSEKNRIASFMQFLSTVCCNAETNVLVQIVKQQKQCNTENMGANLYDFPAETHRTEK